MRTLLCIALVACTSRTPVEKPYVFTVTPICSPLRELDLYIGPDHPGPFDLAFAKAHAMAHFHNYNGIHRVDTNPTAAATDFLACARSYHEIAADDRRQPLAQSSAERCTKNVADAYARAGKMTTDGQLALRQLAIDEPRLERAVASALEIWDCAETTVP